MFDSKYGSLLTILLIAVIIGIIAVLGYFGYQWLAVNNIENAAQDAANQFDSQYPTIVVADENGVPTNDVINGTNVTPQENTNKKVMLEGYEVIGTIRIPTISLKYPILEKVTKKSLETSVAMLDTEKGLNKPGNTVILGHNYRNSQFFSKNDKLKKGDSVYIKDTSGVELKYIITDKFEADSTDASFYRSSDYSKTRVVLSTCTDDASETDKRIIIIAETANYEPKTNVEQNNQVPENGNTQVPQNGNLVNTNTVQN